MMTAIERNEQHRRSRRRMESIYRETGPELLAFFRRRHDSQEAAEDLYRKRSPQ